MRSFRAVVGRGIQRAKPPRLRPWPVLARSSQILRLTCRNCPHAYPFAGPARGSWRGAKRSRRRNEKRTRTRRIGGGPRPVSVTTRRAWPSSGLLPPRSEEHTSELQSRGHLVCRLLLEKKKKTAT